MNTAITSAVLLGMLLLCCANVPDTHAERKKEDGLKLPDGVIQISLPPGEIRMENIARNGNVLIRLSADKTVVEAKTIFLGDTNGATRFESTKDGILWAPASGGKGFIFGNGAPFVREPGAIIGDPDFHPLDKLKAGSVLLTTPSIRFVFGSSANPRPTGREGDAGAKAKKHDGPNLPDGVTHVALPAGKVRMENTRDEKPSYRVSAGKTVIETREFFFGDGKGAGHWEATKQGAGNVAVHYSGSSLVYQQFLRVDKLKPGSLYLTTPSIVFEWGIDAGPKR
jgi:hypothetical protein